MAGSPTPATEWSEGPCRDTVRGLRLPLFSSHNRAADPRLQMLEVAGSTFQESDKEGVGPVRIDLEAQAPKIIAPSSRPATA